MILQTKPALVVTPREILKNHYIYIDTDTGKILAISPKDSLRHDFEVTFPEEVVAFPALINAHDHLIGSYWPKVGKGPYFNWKGWDDTWKASDVFQERAKTSNLNLYMLGAYKNILSGVTTVMDHVPHKVNEAILPQLPIRTIRNYGVAHEVSSYDLKWGDGVEVEFNRSVQNNWPFVTHIEEGFDDESARGVEYLLAAKALDRHSVLVHGLSLSDNDILHIARSKAHLVWCPASNLFMFDTAARIKAWITAGINISLGTDSTVTGSLNILEEISVAKELFHALYHYNLDDKLITQMVTTNPAKALMLDKKLGALTVGFQADILYVRLKDRFNPYTSLTGAGIDDIILLLRDGKPVNGIPHFDLLFKKLLGYDFCSVELDSGPRLLIGDINRLLRKIWTDLGYKKQFPFIPLKEKMGDW
jgi:5-methylthioadenosine/S-adenosylhomocysteine deaminase